MNYYWIVLRAYLSVCIAELEDVPVVRWKAQMPPEEEEGKSFCFVADDHLHQF